MKLLFILLSFCMLFACTITKRHFGAGYHIEWKRNHLTEEKKDNSNNKILLENNFLPEARPLTPKTPIIENSKSQDSITPGVSKPLINNEIIVQEKKSYEINIIHQAKRKQLEESNNRGIVNEDPTTIEEKPKKVEKFTWFALGPLMLGGSLLMILSLIGFYSSPFGIVLMVLGLLATIFSVISVVRIRKNPDRYKAKWLTWTLFGLSTVGIGALLFMVVYYVLILTNNVDL
ncbi:hypothetical protein D3C71_585910 [compost metagenome]